MSRSSDFETAHQRSSEEWLRTSLGPAGPAGTRLAHDEIRFRSTATRPTGRYEDSCRRILRSHLMKRSGDIVQVFYSTNGEATSRRSHATQVAAIAGSIARALDLDDSLARAIGLAHDLGHTPFGHVGESVLESFGIDSEHASWGAAIASDELRLPHDVLDGIRHSPWSSEGPSTPEGEIVSWADRIAYLTQDIEDAVHAGILNEDAIPIGMLIGSARDLSQQRSCFVNAVVTASNRTGLIAMEESPARELAALRVFNHAKIYRSRAVDLQAQEYGAALSEVIQVSLDNGASPCEVKVLLQSLTDTDVLARTGRKPDDLDIRTFLCTSHATAA